MRKQEPTGLKSRRYLTISNQDARPMAGGPQAFEPGHHRCNEERRKGKSLNSAQDDSETAVAPAVAGQSCLVASAAPSASARSFAQAIDGWMRPPMPQSVLAMTRSRPTASA